MVQGLARSSCGEKWFTDMTQRCVSHIVQEGSGLHDPLHPIEVILVQSECRRDPISRVDQDGMKQSGRHRKDPERMLESGMGHARIRKFRHPGLANATKTLPCRLLDDFALPVLQ